MTIHIDTRPERPSDFGHGRLCICSSCCRQTSEALLMTTSGTLHGVHWTIEDIMGQQPGYRLKIDGQAIATLATRPAALQLRDEYIDDLVQQGLVTR